eukprot:Pompholyxophrys_sp_v1_NODE_2_length_20472_cov_5.132586.p3 type:complete len:453 gc:universal NODE_2_length_20472_cov_5.132586:201-1559(+)
MIKVFPVVHACIIEKRPRQTNKGIQHQLSYFKGTKRFYSLGYWNEEELREEIEKIDQVKNKITDIFTIEITKLTPSLLKMFRYKQPDIDYPSQTVLIDPYILGVWLGDGHSVTMALTNVDKPVIEKWLQYADNLKLDVRTSEKCIRKECNIKSQETTEMNSYFIKSNSNFLRDAFKKYNLFNNKHIPKEYLENSQEVRLQVLAGLIDTDGHKAGTQQYEITQKNKVLSDNIVSLCKSLGFYTTITPVTKSCMYKGEKKSGTYNRINISINQVSPIIPVLLDHKRIDTTKIKSWYNPSIDINGNVIDNIQTTLNKTTWDDTKRTVLYTVVKKFKELEPNQQIPWSRLSSFDDRLEKMSPTSMESCYWGVLMKDQEKYEKLSENIIIPDFEVIEPKWLEKYNSIKKILSEDQSKFSPKYHKSLHHWYYNQRHYFNTMYQSKVQKMNELKDLLNL